MRKSQQTNSRKRAARHKRQVMAHRRLKALWLTMIIQPLKQLSCNTRANRLSRIADLNQRSWIRW